MNTVEISIVRAKITEVTADFILLKNTSDGLFGPELATNQASGGFLSLYNKPNLTNIGTVQILNQVAGIAARNAILVGVGSGFQLQYKTISMMCLSAIKAISEHQGSINNVTIATVSHGVGFGLDRKEVFKTQLFGFKEALEKSGTPSLVARIIFDELEERDFNQLKTHLEELTFGDTPVSKDGDKFYLKLSR